MTSPYPIHAAIFDMDGLLIDSEPLWKTSEHDVLTDLGFTMKDAARLPDTRGLRIDVVVRMWFTLQPRDDISPEQVTQQITDGVIRRLEKTRPLLPGVHDILTRCRELGLKTGLASASPSTMLQRVLNLFDLTPFFDVLVSAEHLPYSKPHPQVYLDAAAALSVPPETCVTLEDSLPGMIATKAAGMRSIVVPAAETRNDPRWSLADVKVERLDQVTAEMLLAKSVG